MKISQKWSMAERDVSLFLTPLQFEVLNQNPNVFEEIHNDLFLLFTISAVCLPKTCKIDLALLLTGFG